MATLLRDGGDLDSVDRSMIDCELSNEKSFKVPPFGMRADIASLDPGKLSLMSASLGAGDGASLHRLKCSRDSWTLLDDNPLVSSSSTSSNSTGTNVKAIATKLVRIVSPQSSNRNVNNDNDRTPLCPQVSSEKEKRKAKKDTVVRFKTNSNTMVLTSNRENHKPGLATNGSNGLDKTTTGRILYFQHNFETLT